MRISGPAFDGAGERTDHQRRNGSLCQKDPGDDPEAGLI